VSSSFAPSRIPPLTLFARSPEDDPMDDGEDDYCEDDERDDDGDVSIELPTLL
jgi:hypothetical protein